MAVISAQELGNTTYLWQTGDIDILKYIIKYFPTGLRPKFVFNISILGSVGLIYLFTSVYLLVILGIGLFISNYTETQQQAMFIAWFFMVIFILMSGLFTPIESMPDWAQKITLFNPIRYFVEIIRMVMLKGAQFSDISKPFLIICFYAVLINLLAVWSYRKTN